MGKQSQKNSLQPPVLGPVAPRSAPSFSFRRLTGAVKVARSSPAHVARRSHARTPPLPRTRGRRARAPTDTVAHAVENDPRADAMADASYIGSTIHLVSQADIRYEGILDSIDPVESTLTLKDGASRALTRRRARRKRTRGLTKTRDLDRGARSRGRGQRLTVCA